jgi:hypothetical protein
MQQGCAQKRVAYVVAERLGLEPRKLPSKGSVIAA